jgi:hypothetical protein
MPMGETPGGHFYRVMSCWSSLPKQLFWRTISSARCYSKAQMSREFQRELVSAEAIPTGSNHFTDQGGIGGRRVIFSPVNGLPFVVENIGPKMPDRSRCMFVPGAACRVHLRMRC